MIQRVFGYTYGLLCKTAKSLTNLSTSHHADTSDLHSRNIEQLLCLHMRLLTDMGGHAGSADLNETLWRYAVKKQHWQQPCA